MCLLHVILGPCLSWAASLMFAAWILPTSTEFCYSPKFGAFCIKYYFIRPNKMDVLIVEGQCLLVPHKNRPHTFQASAGFQAFTS